MPFWPLLCRIICCLALIAAGCGDDPVPEDVAVTGGVELPLTARGSRGNFYRLDNATFEAAGPTTATISSAADQDSVAAALPVGTYRLQLRHGWRLIRVADRLAVPATVREDRLDGVVIRADSTTAVRFAFDLSDGEEIGLGGLTIDIDVNESNAPVSDGDRDGATDANDNCAAISNPSQSDLDRDGIGDACDNCPDIANADQNQATCSPSDAGPGGCPAGSYCPAPSGEPMPCPAGFFCPAQSDAPSECAAGTYCPAQSEAPFDCPGGSYCPAQAEGPTSCPAGSYCSERTAASISCPAGSYCPAQSVAPTPCPAGSYCPGEAAAPVQCPGGSNCPAGSSEPGSVDETAFVDDGTVVASLSASRTGGVAPLLVAFDAAASTGVNAARPFHDLHYRWDFGDGHAGLWAETGHSKNGAIGAVAGHVFDEPGRYTVTLTVRDAQGKGQRKQITIDVEDPEVAFVDNTYCFATGSDFSGCPATAQQITTDNFATVRSMSSEGRRLLLRRGDRWEANDGLGVNARFGTATSMLGAFGPCVAPDARGICENAPVINSTIPDMFLMTVSGDVRIMDIALTGLTGQSQQTGIDLWSGRGTLLYRLRIRGFSVGVVTSFTQETPALVDSDIGQAYTNQVFLAGEQLMVMGNHIHDSALSHVLRVWQAYKSVVSENLIAHASLESDAGRHAFKMHGPGEDELTQTLPSGGTIHRTEFTIVADNTFVASPPWPVSIGPQNVTSDERISNLIIERNFWRAQGPRSPLAPPPFMGVRSSAMGDLTFRNNIFDATGATDGYAALEVQRATTSAVPVRNVVFANNLVYRSDKVGNEISFVTVGEDVEGLLVRNNLGVALSYWRRLIVTGTGTGTVSDHNLWALEASFVSSNPLEPLDFTPIASSASIDAGAPMSVLDDYTGSLRTSSGANDLGPFEYRP